MEDSEIKRTIYVGNLPEKATENILYELFLWAGPIVSVKIPQDRNTRKQRNFGFVCFKHECTVPYAIHLMVGIRLCDRNITVQSRDKAPLSPAHQVGVHSLPDVNGETIVDNDEGLPECREQFEEKQPSISNLNIDLRNRLGRRHKHSEGSNEHSGSDRTTKTNRRNRSHRHSKPSTKMENHRSAETDRHYGINRSYNVHNRLSPHYENNSGKRLRHQRHREYNTEHSSYPSNNGQSRSFQQLPDSARYIDFNSDQPPQNYYNNFPAQNQQFYQESNRNQNYSYPCYKMYNNY